MSSARSRPASRKPSIYGKMIETLESGWKGGRMATGKKIEKKKPSGSRKGTRRSGAKSNGAISKDPGIKPSGLGDGRDRIAEFLALSAREMAAHVFGKPEVWLNHPHPRFGDRTPNDLIENGEEERVRNLLAALTMGLF